MADLANTISEFKNLKGDAEAAINFVKHGPHSFEELQVPSAGGYYEFSSYKEFYKDVYSARLLEKRFGSAGAGYQYHHIVTQGGENQRKIPAEGLQNTNNIVRLPTLLHEAVSTEYSKPAPKDRSITRYQWVQTQPYDTQREEGLRILRELNILK